MHCMIVEDNPLNAKLFVLLLESEGFQVTHVPDAERALDALRRGVPDIVITDLQLPGCSGIELIRMLRSDAATATVRIVAISAYARPQDERAALTAGADAFVSKPIDTRTLGPLLRDLASAA